jgi:hypothetical protein
MSKRTAQVAGLYLGSHEPAHFTGHIEFELRPNGVYYTWRIATIDGSWTASRAIAFQIIPACDDIFEFALKHAITGIRRYRSNRQQTFDVKHWSWQDEAVSKDGNT